MGREGFLLCSSKESEMIFQRREEGLSEWWVGSWFISKEKGRERFWLNCGGQNYGQIQPR